MLIKQESVTSLKLGSQDFWQITYSVLNKSKFTIPLLLKGPEVLSSASDKPKLFAKKFSKNSNLEESGIPLKCLKPLGSSIHLVLFRLFSVTGGFEWFWMSSLQRNIQLMLEFLRAPFLVLYFFYYTLMTFLVILSVILLYMLMLLLCTLGVIRHLIRGNN